MNLKLLQYAANLAALFIETVRIGCNAISSTDNCCLVNTVNAVLVDSEHATH